MPCQEFLSTTHEEDTKNMRKQKESISKILMSARRILIYSAATWSLLVLSSDNVAWVIILVYDAWFVAFVTTAHV
ncbi:hypothetical protein BDE02_04G151300 [Populus trichocarpa]|nr:hypothetical protein BDE02_04G151300 [Populus trichocarpa]